MKDGNLLAPCGLYCGICNDFNTGECKGCASGCECGKCAACWHHTHCDIAQCAEKRGHKTCAECEDLPCTMLIEFCFDPIWRSHRPVIENLRRQKKIGFEAWLAEQKEYWSDPEKLAKYHYMGIENGRNANEYRQKKNLFTPKKNEDD